MIMKLVMMMIVVLMAVWNIGIGSDADGCNGGSDGGG